jgi:O-antigen ligase
MRFLMLIPILVAFVLLEVFIGGARLLYAIPGVLMIAFSSFFVLSKEIKMTQRADLIALSTSLLFASYILIRNRCSEIEYIARLQFFIMAGCLLIYLIFSLVLARPVDRRGLMLFLGILALLQMIPALIQFTQGNQWMPLDWAQRQDKDSWRASGFFISPNNFAGFLEIMALFAISFTIWGRMTIITRILTGYAALICIAGVAISGSRGGYLSIVFGLTTLLILTLIAWRRMQRQHFLLASVTALGAVLILSGGILLLIFLSPVLVTRVMQINDPENMRLLLWHSALQQFHLSPIWGTGGFSFLYFGRLFRDPTVQHDPIHAHNDYLQLLADYGLVGMILFIVFLMAHLRAGGASFLKLSMPSSHAQDPQSDRLALNIGALSAVAAYMVHSVVDFNMQLPLNALMMAVVFSILANPGAPNEESRQKVSGESFRTFLRYTLPVLALALLIYAIPMIRGEYLAERARVALRDGHPKEALEWASSGIAKAHDNPELYFYQGEAALWLSMQDQKATSFHQNDLRHEALESFVAGLKIFPYDSRLALKVAQAQAINGNYFNALTAVDYAHMLDPNSAFVPAYRGIIQCAFDDIDDARESLNQSISLGGQGAMIAQQYLDQLNLPNKSILESQGTTPIATPTIEFPQKSTSESKSTEENGLENAQMRATH